MSTTTNTFDLLSGVKAKIQAGQKIAAEAELSRITFSALGRDAWQNALTDVAKKNIRMDLLLHIAQDYRLAANCSTACVNPKTRRMYVSPDLIMENRLTWENLLFFLLHEKEHVILHVMFGEMALQGSKMYATDNTIEDIFVNAKVRSIFKKSFDPTQWYYEEAGDPDSKLGKNTFGLYCGLRGDFGGMKQVLTQKYAAEVVETLRANKRLILDAINSSREVTPALRATGRGRVAPSTLNERVGSLVSALNDTKAKAETIVDMYVAALEISTTGYKHYPMYRALANALFHAMRENQLKTTQEKGKEDPQDKAPEPLGGTEDAEDGGGPPAPMGSKDSEDSEDGDLADVIETDDGEGEPDSEEEARNESDGDAEGSEGASDSDEECNGSGGGGEEEEGSDEKSSKSGEEKSDSEKSDGESQEADGSDESNESDSEEGAEGASGESGGEAGDEAGGDAAADGGMAPKGKEKPEESQETDSEGDSDAEGEEKSDRPWESWNENIEALDMRDVQKESDEDHSPYEREEAKVGVMHGQRLRPVHIREEQESRMPEWVRDLVEIDPTVSVRQKQTKGESLQNALTVIGDQLVGEIRSASIPTDRQRRTLAPVGRMSARELVYITGGYSPPAYHQNVEKRAQKIVVYVDVSSSMDAYWKLLTKLMKMLADQAGDVYQFSSDLALTDAHKSVLFTTGMTDYNIVAQHIVNEGFTSVIVLTDHTAHIRAELIELLGQQLETLYLISTPNDLDKMTWDAANKRRTCRAAGSHGYDPLSGFRVLQERVEAGDFPGLTIVDIAIPEMLE